MVAMSNVLCPYFSNKVYYGPLRDHHNEWESNMGDNDRSCLFLFGCLKLFLVSLTSNHPESTRLQFIDGANSEI